MFPVGYREFALGDRMNKGVKSSFDVYVLNSGRWSDQDNNQVSRKPFDPSTGSEQAGSGRLAQ
jgi:hypothetical protein